MSTETIPLRAVLRINCPGQSEQVIHMVEGQRLQAGRDKSNDIVLMDNVTSRIHAAFTASPTGLLITDMVSRNGTFVNGSKILAEQRLKSGDIVDIGSVKISVEVMEPAEQSQDDAQAMPEIVTAQLVPVQITVLLAYLGGTEQLLKQNATAEVQRLLVTWHDMVEHSLAPFGGKVDNGVVPSIMSYWAGEDEKALACTACNAALGMRDAIPEMLGALKRRIKTDAKLKIELTLSSGQGLKRTNPPDQANSGMDFIILGDPAKVAFCLQEVLNQQEGYNFIMPESTARLVKTVVQVKKVFSVCLKGKEGLITAYTIET